MNDTTDDVEKVREMRQRAADAYGRELDPLASIQNELYDQEIDPILMFKVEVLDNKDHKDATRQKWDMALRQWVEFMEDQGRHPACPNENHVVDFVRHLRVERENSDQVIRQKLGKINTFYEYCQADDGLAHPNGYNPINKARQKINVSSFNDVKPVPRLGIGDLQRVIQNDVTHTLYRALIASQLKFGLRRKEVCNIKLEHVNLVNEEVNDFYSELGTHPFVADRPNSIYIPSRDEMDGNKSSEARVLPMDDEMRQVFLRYLLVRPTVDQPWFFLSKKAYGKLRDQSINIAWKEAFHPEYEFGEDDHYRSVTSHYGRHFFSNYWEAELAQKGLPLKYAMYMRGDKIKAEGSEDNSIDHYLQTYYEDVRDIYMDGIYRLGLSNL